MSFQKAFAVSALAMAAVGGSNLAHAQLSASSPSSPYYMGVSLGQSYSSLGAATKKSLAGMDETNDLRNISGKLFVGYHKDKNWATEAGYANMGKATTYASSAREVDSIGAKLSTFYVALVASENATEKLSVFGKLGVALNHSVGYSDRHVPGASNRFTESSWNPSPMLGLGLQYQLIRNVGLRAEYEYVGRMGAKGTYKTGLVTAGVIYNF